MKRRTKLYKLVKKMGMYKRDMLWLYIAIGLVGFFASMAILFLSRGEVWNKLFFLDSIDTGMDFFHSIEYTRGRSPYELFSTLYPPLANLFFYILFRFVPEWQYSTWADTFDAGVAARGSEIDLRYWQPTMTLFILFLLGSTILVFLLVSKCIKASDTTKANLFCISVLLSYGMLFAFERGNVVVLAWMCALFFVKYRNSNNKTLRELSLVVLAISAGLKMYPAVLGMLLIYERSYKRAVRAVIYGIAAFVLPLFAFKEGFSGLKIFFQVLTGHSDSGAESYLGYDLSGMFNLVLKVISEAFHVEINFSFGMLLNIVACAIVLALGFMIKKEWQRVWLVVTAMLLLKSQTAYGMLFLFLPMITLINDEKELNKKNAAAFFIMTASTVLLPIFDIPNAPYRLTILRTQICMASTLTYFIVLFVKSLVEKRASAKSKQRKQLVIEQDAETSIEKEKIPQ